MMYTVQDVAAAVGLSVPQVRRRLNAIETDLDGDLARGTRGKLLLSEKGLAFLRRIVDLEKERGLTCNDAVKVMHEELRKPDEDGEEGTIKFRHGPVTGVSQSREAGSDESPLVRELRARIADKEREITRLENEVHFLRTRVEELTPLALPRPRRRWLAWLHLAGPGLV